MHRDVKLILSMFLNFIYSLCTICIVFFYSLMGTVAMDRLCIIITEATGFERQEKMISAILSPTIIQNLFWLSIAGVLFCIIFLYLLHQNFSTLWGPASITIMLFLVMLGLRSQFFHLMPSDTDLMPSTPYILNVLDRFLHANIGILVFGLILSLIALFGDKLISKNKFLDQ